MLFRSYRSLNVRHDEWFTMIESLKESYPVTTLCSAFSVHRSSYKYGAKRLREIKPERLKEHALVKSIFRESNGSAGARTIAQIATDRKHPLSRYRAGRLMKACQKKGSSIDLIY